MSQIFFRFSDIEFKTKGDGVWVVAEGEICNESSKDFQTAAFRLSVFDSLSIRWTGILKIQGFRKGQTRPFELLLDGLPIESLSGISRYDINFESGF